MAVLPEMVESSTLNVPELEIPPPPPALFPEIVESSSVSVPEFAIPPPAY